MVTSPADLADGVGPITGTAEAGATIIVRDSNGNELGRDTADGEGNWSVTLDQSLTDGTHDLVISAQDAAGNTSDPTTVTVTIDTDAPTAPVVTSPADLADGVGPITGTAEAGATIIVRDSNGNELGRDTADGEGNWSVTLDQSLTDGTHDLVISAQDAAGNTSDPTTVTVTIDTDAPTAPVVTSPADLADGVGPITGTAEAGATIIVRDSNGNELGRDTADGEGNWSVTLDQSLTDGTHDLVISAQDAAGNTSDPTTVTVTIDTDAPTAPVVTSPADLADGVGPITGTAEAGATIIVRDSNGNELGRDTADGEGNWSVTLDQSLTDGTHDLVISAQDAAGNTSDPTTVTVTIDTDAPTAPVVTSPADLADGVGPITGTAEAGATIIVRDSNGNELGRDTADGEGNWSVTLDQSLTDGTHDLVISAQDAAGNTSDPTTVTVTIDTDAPTAPVVTSPADLADGVGPITGTAEAGATIIVRDSNGNELGRDTADGEGNWSVTLDQSLTDGTHDLVISAQDAAGNTSDPTTVTVTIDTDAPTAPVVTSPADLADGVGPITGTAEAGATIIVRDSNGNELGRDTADGEGNWSVTLDQSLTDGTHDLVISAQDAAGNTSDPTTVTVTIDTDAPTAPVVTSPADLADGVGPITGTAEAGATIIVRDSNGNELGRDTADGEGNWSVTLDQSLTDGTHDLVISAQDAAGNTSDPTTVTVTIDTDAPTAPVVTSPADLADGVGPITGTAEAGATIIVRDSNGNELGRDTADGEGNWSVTLDQSLTDGTHDLVISAQDAAGNTSDPTTVTVTIDTDAPTAPVVTSPADLADGVGPITGTAEAGATIIVRDSNGNELGRDTADGEGNWSVTLDQSLTDGTHDLVISAQDAAGNTSDPTTVTVTIDTDAPTAPVVTSPADLADGVGPITGTAEAGATIIVRDSNGNELGRDTADGEGNWSVTLDQSLTDGTHDLVISAQDAAGNTSDPTTVTVTIDTDAPTAPVVTSPADLADGVGPITGTAEAGATIIVRDSNGNELGRDTADGEGNWSVTLDQSLTDGTHDLVISAQDAAGNTSDPTTVTVTIDTDAPTAPVVTSPADLADGVGPITGTAEAGATIIVRDSNGNELGRDTADGEGNWSVTLDQSLTDGTHDLVISAQDAAGNTSDPTTVTVTIDTDAPTAPVLERFDDIIDGTGVVRGTAEAGSTVIIRDEHGNELGRGVADQEGNFVFRTTVPLAPGAHLLTVVAVDEVGNVSEASSMLVTLVPDEGEQESGSGSEDGEQESGSGSEDESRPLPEVTPTDGASTSGTGTAPAGNSSPRPDADELAFTGAELGGWLSAALAALGLGVALRLLSRRGRDRVRED